jgi:sulfofructose kinase
MLGRVRPDRRLGYFWLPTVPLPSIPQSTPSRPFDVVGFGQNSVDLLAAVSTYPLPDSHAPVERFLELPGGEIATAMVACARLGCRARYVGAAGSDSRGDLVRDRLHQEAVDITSLRRVSGPNRLAVILVDGAGRRTVLWHRPPDLVTRPSDVDIMAVTSGRVLLVDAIDPEASVTAARAARDAGCPTVVDVDVVGPHTAALLAEIDVVITSRAFPEMLTGAGGLGAGLRSLARQFGSALVVATLGEEGTLALFEGREIRTPAWPVDVVDTTGAGDAFRGGFIASWIRWGSRAGPETLLRFANAVGALNCRSLGAQTGLPDWTAVEQLVTRAPDVRSK